MINFALFGSVTLGKLLRVKRLYVVKRGMRVAHPHGTAPRLANLQKRSHNASPEGGRLALLWKVR